MKRLKMKRFKNVIAMSLFALYGFSSGGCLMNLQDLLFPPLGEDCSRLIVGDETFEFCI